MTQFSRLFTLIEPSKKLKLIHLLWRGNRRVYREFIGSRNSLHTTEIARTNEQPRFIFKNLSSSRMRASRIATSKTSAKYRKISFICGLFKLYFDKKRCQQVSKIILVYIYVVFKAVFCLLLINYGFIFVCVFQKVERVANLMIFTIYVISLPEQSSCTFAIINLVPRLSPMTPQGEERPWLRLVTCLPDFGR